MLGGTFDPVHLAHLVLGEATRELLGLDRVLFIPTGHSWRKEGREISSGEDRLEMIRLAIAGNPCFEASSIEVDREGPSYSDVTLEALAADNPGAEIYFILGRDALNDLPNWHNPRRILELATLAVAERPGTDSDLVGEGALPGLEARIEWVSMPAVGITATDIRRRVREGRSIRYMVPAAVEDYIVRRGLYASQV